MHSTGISEQDAQHMKLIDITNRVYEAMNENSGKDVLNKLLSELMDYGVHHFDYEEKLMAQLKEDSSEHKAEHAEFIQSINRLKEKFNSGNTASAVKIMEFIRVWLPCHMMKTDKKLAIALKKNGVLKK